MDALVAKPFGKRFILALLLTAALAVQFWTQSRYPSLNEKAIMSGAMQLEDSLSFEALIPVLPEYPWWKKIGVSTINWIKTNERGMTFGVLFGAAFLTLLGYLRRVSFANSVRQFGSRHGDGRAARRVRELRGADRQGHVCGRRARRVRRSPPWWRRRR